MKYDTSELQVIHTDHNGVTVRAFGEHSRDGNRVAAGHCYVADIGERQEFITFQIGPVKENGVNGLTNEALLAVLIDRTKNIDAQFPCTENKNAIEHMQAALDSLESRTRNRLARGVEGQNKV